jgi:hypothetical protein
MTPFVIAARIIAFLLMHPEVVSDVIKATQAAFGDRPGDERFAVVRAVITEALDMTDPDDKLWEKAWRIARPFFDKYVAKVKGKILAAAAAPAAAVPVKA